MDHPLGSSTKMVNMALRCGLFAKLFGESEFGRCRLFGKFSWSEAIFIESEGGGAVPKRF
jgi:hypothetical protein